MYYNCIFKYGPENFFKKCNDVGVDGIIIPDLPYEERHEIDDIAEKYSIDLITLVSPTSKDRIEKIAKNSKGFLYCVTSLGVTGTRENFDTNFNEYFSYINKFAKIPKALGFNISTPEHIRNLKKYCDGLIVGSAIVKIVEEYGNKSIIEVGKYINSLRVAMDD
jgi:tryptophan synthase alpha chain